MARQCITDFNALVRGLIKAKVDLTRLQVYVIHDSLQNIAIGPLRMSGDGLRRYDVNMPAFGEWNVSTGQYSPKVIGLRRTLRGNVILVDHRQFIDDDQRLDHLY